MGPELLVDFKSWLDSIADPVHDLPDDVTCRQILADIRFVPGFRCPHCGSQRGYRSGTHHPHWRCRDCRYRTSVTAGTIMHGSHLPVRTWAAAAWYQTHLPKGISALRFAALFDLPYFTSWRLNHNVRTCFCGSQRGDIVEDAEPSTACIQILGRHRPEEPELEAFCAVDLTTRDLVHAVAPQAEAARTVVDAAPGKKHQAARWLAESFRTAIIGTYNGVSVKWLPRYAAEFFGRWSGTLADVAVFERLVAPRPIPRDELWDDLPPFEPDDDDPPYACTS